MQSHDIDDAGLESYTCTWYRVLLEVYPVFSNVSTLAWWMTPETMSLLPKQPLYRTSGGLGSMGLLFRFSKFPKVQQYFGPGRSCCSGRKPVRLGKSAQKYPWEPRNVWRGTKPDMEKPPVSSLTKKKIHFKENGHGWEMCEGSLLAFQL